MVSARSDKFNAQMGTATVRSHPSQLDLGADRMLYVDGPSFSTDSSMDQKATTRSFTGGQSRGGGWPDHIDLPSAGSSEIGGFPKYSLRILAPKHDLAMDAQSRPESSHIPGSYRSEKPAEVYVASRSRRNLQGVDHEGHDHDTLNLEDHLGLIIENSTAAAKTALNAVSEHNQLAEKQSPKIDSGAKSALQEHNEIVDDAHSIPHRSSSLRTICLTPKEGEQNETAPLLPKQSFSSILSQAEDRTRRSPVSRALSVVSKISDCSRSTMRSSSLLAPSKKRSSLARTSELQYTSATPPSVPTFNRENQTKKGIPEAVTSKDSEKLSTTTISTNLTARPSHLKGADVIERTQSIHERCPWTADARSVSRAGADSEDSLHVAQRQQTNDQSFSKAILDLENLLTEALSMAGNKPDSNKLEERSQSIQEDLLSESEQLRVVDSNEPSRQNRTRHSGGGNETCNPTKLSAKQGPPIQLHLDDGRSCEHRAIPEADRSWGSTAAARTQWMSPCSGEDTGALTYYKNMKHDSEVGSATQSVPSRSTSSHVAQTTLAKDWALENARCPVSTLQIQQPPIAQASYKEKQEPAIHHEARQRPPHIQSRSTSIRMPAKSPQAKEALHSYDTITSSGGSESDGLPYVADYVTAALQYHPIIREISGENTQYAKDPIPLSTRGGDTILAPLVDKEIKTHASRRYERGAARNDFNLKDRHHFSIREPHGFSLSRSHRRRPIARDWSTSRKRFVATVTCITTSLMGLILGVYAGEVPAIQYTLADEHHYTILGNVVFFLGLAITTILLWPLPLLHGRKPYTLAALAILLPLQFPQGLAVNGSRSPDAASSRVGILLPRALSGLVMGFANINFMTTLLDLFGASLQSGNPHQEVVDKNDVRRHGGGIGAWLGIWTWCSIMSIGLGFLIGAGIISGISVAWGFWLTILLNAVVLVLNVMVPEVRRSPYRRSMAEVRTGTEISRRVARGEIKMHLESTGPKTWYEEVSAGHALCLRMLKQPGFLILALYQGWIYGQVVMIVVLLGALLSRYYHFHPQYVGLGVAFVPLAALLAVPFQKAGLFSRARRHKQRTDSMTFQERVTWTSHLVRRSIFMIALPFAGLAYTLASNGTVHFMAPILFAGLIGFLSNLAIAECNGLMMETFDTSDLQPGMTGRPRRELPEEIRQKRTNFSCFPRVTAAFAVAQTFAFLIAAGATGWGGVIERHLGAQTATAVIAGILLILTLLLIGVLWRFKTVQIIPSQRFGTNILSGPEDEWKPIIIGNPSGTTRRMNILELGRLSRWSEIRARNRLGSV